MSQQKSGAMASLPPVTGAAVVTAFTMYPVDIVRALVMAQASGEKQGIGTLVSNFYKAHGAAGFIKQGLGAEMMRATFSRSIKFWLQPVVHKSVFGKQEKNGNAFTKGVSGALATIPEVIAISPFENAKLAQQLDKQGTFKGTGDVFKHLMNTRGVQGLYLGYFGMQIRQMMWTGGFFLSLDIFRKQAECAMGGKSAAADTLAGFGAGVFGTLLNCWTDVVRTAIQKQSVADTFNPEIPRPPLNVSYLISGPTSVANTAGEIFAQRGIAGLYAGFAVKSIYLGGSGAILSVLVPRFKKMWGCSD